MGRLVAIYMVDLIWLCHTSFVLVPDEDNPEPQ